MATGRMASSGTTGEGGSTGRPAGVCTRCGDDYSFCSQCIFDDDGEGYCAPPCASDADCPRDDQCWPFELDGGEVHGCFPKSKDCERGSGADSSTGGSTGTQGGMCSPCQDNSQCEPQATCIVEDSDHRYCSPRCDDDDDCAAGAKCFALSNGARGCYPASETCTGRGPPSTGTTLGSTGTSG
jgi:hypothetical protein